MASPINVKYPLFLRDFGKNKANNEGNSAAGGYPIITVQDNFNINARPNTFYNIKNTTNDKVNINFNSEEFYATGKNKHIMFTWDINIYESIDIQNMIILYTGGIVVKDNSIEGYKYRIDIDGTLFDIGTVSVYLSDDIIEGASIRAYTNMMGSEKIIEMNNIHIIN